MEESSGVELDWFWRGWFYGTGHVDIALDRASCWRAAGSRDATRLCRFDFRNVGGVVMPIILELTFTDGSRETIRIPAEIWRRNSRAVSWQWLTDRTPDKVEVDPRLETADTDRGNNLLTGPIAMRELEER